MEAIAREEGLTVLGWRDVPIAADLVGQAARDCMPHFVQLIVADADRETPRSGIELDRLAFCLRKRAELEAGLYFASLSARTLVYKGMLTTGQLEPFFPDLSDRAYETELALVHSRFSTNTFPSWELAHPYRLIAHNGEINTVKGNRNWMRSRESQLSSELIPGDLQRLFPVCTPGASDSATFDEVLELLHLGGRSLPHAVLMMIPEAWENHAEMDPARRAFYEFHATFMEPWDGPACVAFTDGSLIGAVLDRNGLRPGRYWVTDEGLVVLASEVGVLELDPARVVRKGRLQPGRMFLVDTEHGRLVSDDQIKSELAAEHPYDEWLHAGLIHLAALPPREHIVHTRSSVTRRQQTFGYTEEELRLLLAPMARSGAEPIGSMGTDTPVAVLSDRPRLLFDYFTQLFAQVTNPPLDAIREELVTALGSTIGPEYNALEATPNHCRQLILPGPVIDNDELAKIVHINADGDLPGYATHVVKGLYDVTGGGAALRARLAEICAEVSSASTWTRPSRPRSLPGCRTTASPVSPPSGSSCTPTSTTRSSTSSSSGCSRLRSVTRPTRTPTWARWPPSRAATKSPSRSTTRSPRVRRSVSAARLPTSLAGSTRRRWSPTSPRTWRSTPKRSSARSPRCTGLRGSTRRSRSPTPPPSGWDPTRGQTTKPSRNASSTTSRPARSSSTG